MLKATVKNRTLVVSGAAAQSGYDLVGVEAFGSGLRVTDNTSVRSEVAIEGDITRIRNLDLSGVTGAGASVYAFGLTNARVTGTEQGDRVSLGEGADRVKGLGGDDALYGAAGDDVLDGGKGFDTLSGGSGADTITGGAGNDTIDGGDGLDVAVFSGNRSDYRLTIVDGSYQLSDLRTQSLDGTDTIGNVEQLRFADRTIDLAPPPSNLTAIVDGRTLVVSGAAARSSWDTISVEVTGSGIRVSDNNQFHTDVAVTGDATQIRNIDLSDVTVAGAYIYAGLTDARVTATEQDDNAYLGQGADRAIGLGGNDVLSGNEGDDVLDGGKGTDFLYGGEGVDTITGGAGNDTIDGGDGLDVAVYGGNRSDYRLQVVDGSYQLTDLRAHSLDGVDTIGNVEQLRFADRTIDLPPNPTDLVAVVDGRTLVVSGQAAQSGYAQIGVEFTSSGVRVVDNGSVRSEVTIAGDATQIKSVDLSAVTEAGAYVYAFVPTALRVVATEQVDFVYTGQGADRASGLGGDDALYGNDGDDVLDGGKGADRLNGGAGADIITGGAGNDLIDGGDDFDIAIFAGNRADYRIESVDGSYQVTDLRARSLDGVDTLGNVEQLQFADRTVNLTSAAAEDVQPHAYAGWRGLDDLTVFSHGILV